MSSPDTINVCGMNEAALRRILSKPLTLGSERRALTLLGLLGVKPLRAAGKGGGK
jgi:hypothetical protein